MTLTIHSIEATPVIAPMKRPIRTASGEIPAAPLVLITLKTDQGVTGCAYIFAYTPLTLKPLIAFFENLDEAMQGASAAPGEVMENLRSRFRLLGCQGLVGMAASGLEMAAWDALGKALGQPVATLLGGTPKPLDAYDSFGILDPKADAPALEASLEQGFKAIKIKIGGGDLNRDVATVSEVRRIIGPETALMVDYNQSLAAPEAARRIRRLEEFDLLWVEEPVFAEDYAGHALVREKVSAPIQTGENWWFPSDMEHAVESGACDFAMLDLMKIGGISGWLRAAALAEAASLPVSSHLFVEATAHVLPVTPTCHWLEWLDIASAVLDDPLIPSGGTVTAKGPGLGMAWDDAAVEKYRF